LFFFLTFDNINLSLDSSIQPQIAFLIGHQVKTFCLGVTMLCLLPCLIVFLLLTPPQYAQCKGLEPDECFDVLGPLHKLTIDFSCFVTYFVNYSSPGLSGLSKLILFSHSSTGCFVPVSLREATLTPVLLI